MVNSIVKVNKSNGVKFLYLPKDTNLREGDSVSVDIIKKLTKEEVITKIKNNPNFELMYNKFKEIRDSTWNNIEWEFIEEMKKSLNIKSIESDEGYELFQCDGFEIEYIWGEGFNDDFGEAHIPFINNGMYGFSSSYFEQILKNKDDMKLMVKNTQEISNIKIYTDLVESYHKEIFRKYKSIIYNLFKIPFEELNDNCGEFNFEVENMEINVNVYEWYSIISYDKISVYLSEIFK